MIGITRYWAISMRGHVLPILPVCVIRIQRCRMPMKNHTRMLNTTSATGMVAITPMQTITEQAMTIIMGMITPLTQKTRPPLTNF